MGIRYSENIPLSQATIQAWSRGVPELQEPLKLDIENSAARIVSLLRNYQRLKDSVGFIHTFSINEISNDPKGLVFCEVKYPVRISYGCKDLNEWVEEKMVLSLQVDFEHTSAVVTGAEALARDLEKY